MFDLFKSWLVSSNMQYETNSKQLTSLKKVTLLIVLIAPRWGVAKQHRYYWYCGYLEVTILQMLTYPLERGLIQIVSDEVPV